MIVITCLPCSLALRVMPEVVTDPNSVRELEYLVGRQSDFWPNKYPCPRCGENGSAIDEREADPRALQLLELVDLTPAEAFSVLNGLGFPDEQRCTLEVVEELLQKTAVRRVVGRNVAGMERTVIDALELVDGTKVHFGSGADGAVIYRITQPVSYTRKALEAGT